MTHLVVVTGYPVAPMEHHRRGLPFRGGDILPKGHLVPVRSTSEILPNVPGVQNRSLEHEPHSPEPLCPYAIHTKHPSAWSIPSSPTTVAKSSMHRIPNSSFRSTADHLQHTSFDPPRKTTSRTQGPPHSATPGQQPFPPEDRPPHFHSSLPILPKISPRMKSPFHGPAPCSPPWSSTTASTPSPVRAPRHLAAGLPPLDQPEAPLPLKEPSAAPFVPRGGWWLETEARVGQCSF